MDVLLIDRNYKATMLREVLRPDGVRVTASINAAYPDIEKVYRALHLPPRQYEYVTTEENRAASAEIEQRMAGVRGTGRTTRIPPGGCRPFVGRPLHG